MRINNNVTSTGSDQWDYCVLLTVDIKIVGSCTAIKNRCKKKIQNKKKVQIKLKSFFKKIVCSEFQEINNKVEAFPKSGQQM